LSLNIFVAIWMSQFLDCFSEKEIISILTRTAQSMDKNANLYILETYIDRQKYEPAEYCVVNTSLYFTCMANGNSRMYRSDDMIACIQEAGLQVVEDKDEVGFSHTLFRCQIK